MRHRSSFELLAGSSPLISIALTTNDFHSVNVGLPRTIIIGRVMNRIINTCISAALLVFSAGLTADDHASSSPLFYGQSFGFAAEDAGAVVAAMEKWRSSKAGKAGPNTVVLIQNLVNGDFDSTHGVNVFYQNGAAMDASAAASNGTEEWAEFQASMAELTEREWENMYSITRAKVKEGDVSSANPVSMVFAFTVTDPAGFMSAFDAFWNSSAVQDFPGAVYLGQTIAAGMMPGTHFVTWVADSRGNLVEAMQAVRNSPDTDAYRIAVSGKRTLEATNMSIEVKRWVNGG